MKDQTPEALTTQKVCAILRANDIKPSGIYERVRKTQNEGVVEVALLRKPNQYVIDKHRTIFTTAGLVIDEATLASSMEHRDGREVRFLVSFPAATNQ